MTAIVLALIGLIVAIRARRQALLVRNLTLLRPQEIQTARPGLVQVHGRLEADEPLTSPLQKRLCLYYFFRATEPRPGKLPRQLATGKDWTDVRVRDVSGAVDVVARTALVASPRRHERVFQGLETIPEEDAAFFEKAGIDAKHLPRLPPFLVHEYTLEPGDEVTITGTLVQDEKGRRITRWKKTPLVVSAHDDLPLIQGLRNEGLIYTITSALLLLGSLALALMGYGAP